MHAGRFLCGRSLVFVFFFVVWREKTELTLAKTDAEVRPVRNLKRVHVRVYRFARSRVYYRDGGPGNPADEKPTSDDKTSACKRKTCDLHCCPTAWAEDTGASRSEPAPF